MRYRNSTCRARQYTTPPAAPLAGIARFASWCAVLAFMGLIYYLSETPRLGEITASTPLVSLFPGWTWEWLYHGAVFGGLTALTYVAMRVSLPANWQTAALLALTVALAYAAIDEWHQGFVPGRDADIGDVGRDAVGALSVILVARAMEMAAVHAAHGR